MSTVTPSQKPMELLGSQTGVNVIDPSTILTRLWYFDGRFLRADGFRMDQDYVRSLVALSNQAVGHGLVSGFTPSLPGGDRISVTGGLGLAPSGRPVYLPSSVDLSIASLIDRSSGNFNPAVQPAPGTADFSPCPPEPPATDIETASNSTVYLLTVAASEALCGEEEKFGRLCEDACAAESDRSVAVEGVRFQVRPLQLTLPQSQTVPFTALHHRSRVASAYFAAERKAVASTISGSGLKSAVWCAGAPGVGGEELPLAVFDRVGAVTSWLDVWTARREINETNPQRHWSRRFAMRPLDVFWAQVLQFQCQLLALGSRGSDGGGPDDPCAEERVTLQAASSVINSFLARSADELATSRFEARSTISAADIGELGGILPRLAQDRLLELSDLIGKTLTGKAPTATGSLLLDGGLCCLPPAGYLPVDPAREIRAQVRAYMGPGVDLRFCAVRPDYIPEALQEAQHMDRISLTAGLDDPDDIEEVDVLVPDGRIEESRERIDAFQGIVRIGPDGDDPDRASLRLRVIGREQPGDTWSWTMAGHSETRPGLRLADVNLATTDFMRGRDIADAALRERFVNLRESGADFNTRLSTDAARRSLLGLRARAGAADLAAAAADQQEIISLWLDFELQDDLRNVSIGDRVNARIAGTVHAARSDEEDLRDFRYRGDLVVTAFRRQANGAVQVRTSFTGFIDRFLYESGSVQQDDSVPTKGFEMEWTFDQASRGVKQLTMSMDLDKDTRNPRTLTLQLQEVGSPRRISGTLVNVGSLGENEPVVFRLADGSIEETGGALDPGSFGRDMADGVIDVIGSAMIRSGRDANWGLVAERRMLGDSAGGGTSLVRSDHDWVMFHRRRTKVCAGDVIERPLAIRTYRWYHVDVPNMTDEARKRIRTLLASTDPVLRAALIAELDFSLVSNLSFREDGVDLVSSPVAFRADWSARVASKALEAAIVADPPTGDGPVVALGRLNTGLTTIGGLIDMTPLQPPAPVNEIPAEYQSRGTDGVVFTIGSSPVEVDTASALLVRVPMEALDLVASVSGTMTMDRLRSELANFNVEDGDFRLAEYADDNVVNKDEVSAWWGGVRLGASILLGTPKTMTGAVRDRWLGPRGDVMTEILGGSERPVLLDRTTWEIPEADVVMVLGRERDGLRFDDAVLDVVLTAQPDFRRREFQVLEAVLLQTHPTADELRSLAADFGVEIDRIDWTQPMGELGRDVLRVAHETAGYREMVTEVHRRHHER